MASSNIFTILVVLTLKNYARKFHTLIKLVITFGLISVFRKFSWETSSLQSCFGRKVSPFFILWPFNTDSPELLYRDCTKAIVNLYTLCF